MIDKEFKIDRKREIIRIVISAVTFLCVIIFLVLAVKNSSINNSDTEFMITAKAVEAVCVDMNSYSNNETGETHYNIYVDFEYKGDKYDHIEIADIPPEYTNVTLGSKITVYCSPSNAADCRLKRTQREISTISVIFCIAALIFFVVGAVSLRKVLRDRYLLKLAKNQPDDNLAEKMYDGLNGGENIFADNGLNDPMINYNELYSNSLMDSIVNPNDVYGYGGGNPMDAPVNPNDVYGYGGGNPMDAPVNPNDVYGYGGGNPMDTPVNPNDVYGYGGDNSDKN